MNVNELTRKLIDIPSVTGDEKAVGLFLQSLLKSLGYVVQLQEVAAERLNVFANTGAPARVVLSTHMDTVPPFIQSREDDQKIYGRGACDAKGIIAAQICAAERLRSEGIEEIGLLFTVDEEQGSRGAQVANLYKPAVATKYLINGEPTDNKLASATKGSLRIRNRASQQLKSCWTFLQAFANARGRPMMCSAKPPATSGSLPAERVRMWFPTMLRQSCNYVW
jgi:acetylornithine deacetylase